MIIEKKYHFYAAHRNTSAGDKCGRIHGHTYEVEIQFAFETMKDGVCMLFSDIDAMVEPIIKEYDHYFLLYDLDPLVGVLELQNEPFKILPFETSAENMAVWITTRIMTETPLTIKQLKLSETKSSSVVYEP